MIGGDEVVEYLLGSCETISATARVYKLTETDVRNAITHGDIACCETCGWWYEKADLDVYDGDHICHECLDN